MNKILSFLYVFLMVLLISCKTETSEDSSIGDGNIENANVYLLGIDSYWKNGKQYKLNIPEGYNDVNTKKIIASNGKVFVTGSFYIQNDDGISQSEKMCYWQDGNFNTFSSDNTINIRNVFVSNGNMYASSFGGYWWIGKTQNKIPSDKSSIYDLFVYNNTVYMSGYNYDNSNWVACYWMNNNKFVLSTPKNYYSPSASGVFVDGGNVYCCGDYLGKVHYWINGTMFNIETPTVNRYETNDIIVSAGKIFIFGSFSHATEGGIVTPCYWEDGILKLLPTGTNMAINPIVYNGKVYTFDNEWPMGKANYFINGETFPIDPLLDYTRANSIFIFNDDVFITGGYYDNNFQYQPCYWINGIKRINLNYSIKDIFIEQK
jgi:hypothetical protein